MGVSPGWLVVAALRGEGFPGRATLHPRSDGSGGSRPVPGPPSEPEVQPGVVSPFPGGTVRGSERIFSNARRFF